MYKNCLIVGFFILCGAGVQAGTTIVCKNCPVKTITQALKLSAYCDTILVRNGTYSEGRIYVTKSITLIGDNLPIVDGKDTSEVFTILEDFVTISGFQIQNVGTSYIEDKAGIRVKESSHFEVTNNRLFNTFFGIYIENSNNGTINYNTLEGLAKDEMSSGNAIHMWHCNKLSVTHNTVKGHRDGIYFEFVDSTLIHKNVSEDNIRYGLHFMFSNDNNYYDNIFRRNGAGVAVMFSKRINMWDNLFELNWGRASYGLLLKEIYDTEIRNNLFDQNSIGIYAEGSTRINYVNNEFKSNGWAIKISGGCLDNHVNGNNFIANTFDISIKSSSTEYDFEGNYWSDYTGYDLDHDGTGDVPYRPVKLFNYIVNRTPEAMVLLRSFFVDIINFSEKVSPIFTPAKVFDATPSMTRIPIENSNKFSHD